MAEKLPRYWIDQVRQKHECMPYDAARRLSVAVGDIEYSIAVPNYLPEMKLLLAMPQNDLLFAIGVTDELFGERPTGFFLVARREEENAGEFSAVVWHEMYPYAIKRLGLDSPA